MTTPAILDAWEGLGDTVYLRPTIRVLAEHHRLHVSTPWPELLEDLPVSFVRTDPQYRTQAENTQRQPDDRFVDRPRGALKLSPAVQWARRDLSIPAGIADSMDVRPEAFVFDLPSFDPPAAMPDDPYAVVRPVTVRKEWLNEARNPEPRYVAAAAAHVRDALDLPVVSVAHLAEGEEWALEPLPPADVTLHHGELSVTELLYLIEHATVVIGAVGFLVPVAEAYRTPCVVIAGGQGWYNSPRKIQALPRGESSHRWILPDDYCRECKSRDHDCPREISDFEGKIEAALEGVMP